jgi:hypothetical protein
MHSSLGGTELPKAAKLFFPDACWHPEIVSGALFLYFRKEPIWFTSHPSVSTFLTGADPAEFFSFVRERVPRWQDKFLTFERMWTHYRVKLCKTMDIIKPLRGDASRSMLLSYSRNKSAWQAGEELIASSNLSFSDISRLIDPFSAADELFSHIFFETFLELYGPVEEPQKFDASQAESRLREPRRIDWLPLYEYVGGIFDNRSLEELLTVSYMFRSSITSKLPGVILSNPNMIDFLSSLPVDPESSALLKSEPIDLDVIGWEFFRQLLSPKIDPLTAESTHPVRQLAESYPSEIDALSRKCLSLGQNLAFRLNLRRRKDLGCKWSISVLHVSWRPGIHGVFCVRNLGECWK